MDRNQFLEFCEDAPLSYPIGWFMIELKEITQINHLSESDYTDGLNILLDRHEQSEVIGREFRRQVFESRKDCWVWQ